MRLRSWRSRFRVWEAATALLFAQMLIRNVRFSRWRRSIGRVDTSEDEYPVVMMDMTMAEAVTRAVRKAARGRSYRCLAQAMATQWMLRRRGLSSRLVVGVGAPASPGQERALHAWVQVGPRIVIGADPTQSYRPALALAQVRTLA